ncbi:hypothetical protein [Pseudoalteromonas piscicida]|uniref:hypothetical protein n=1 Tax=Pseudoalteromonas piscicida TaxID=43662 RepID=UPI003095FF9C
MNKQSLSPQRHLQAGFNTGPAQILGTRAYEYKQLVSAIRPIHGLKEKLNELNQKSDRNR